jgi:hypothetical protein
VVGILGAVFDHLLHKFQIHRVEWVVELVLVVALVLVELEKPVLQAVLLVVVQILVALAT